MWIAVALSLLVGLAIGLLVGRTSRRTLEPVPIPRPAPVDPVPQLLREAVSHLTLGVVVSDVSGAVVYRNESAAARDGTHEGVIVDDHLAGLLARAVRGEEVEEIVELHGPPKVSLKLLAEPLPGGSAVVTIEDVSERLRIEAVRTDFVANISHELKTPVGAIAVLADTLLDETDGAVVRRIAERMIEESHRGVRAIDDLLELSWIESAGPATERVDLHSVVRSALSRGRTADGGRGVTVTAIETPERIELRGDGRQLVAALGNLVENAVKYSHEGGVVQVRTRLDDTAVEVMVADQGIGIPARDLNRIFERFYRVDKARSRATGGNGLGLSIVRHVATNHGGEVLVSSQEGKGSTFVLRLPIELVVAEDDDGRSGGPRDEADAGRGNAPDERDDRGPDRPPTTQDPTAVEEAGHG